ncbi:hypothetical protein BDN72DRAFT_784291 [Pluteus cervinus]|uniref:Uncharacterized protein n=1 Tax=Pluteus cervinus TaxID=181527 RepID=A0ACD3BHB8_9AGAR|nr:hypothetical protein BDN72DRAFT_784291 [Pluteus cervinus]
MVAQKRSIEEGSASRKSKKLKTSQPQATTSTAALGTTQSHPSEEIDFPRGGGTSFTPLEVKAIRAEAAKEADEEFFKEVESEAKKSKKRKRKSETTQNTKSEKNEATRIEHLNYKRIVTGMKIFGQIAAIQPLALIVSLPNQLFAHVPITHISSAFTQTLEAEAEGSGISDDEEDDEESSKSHIPDLGELYQVGHFVRGIVTAVHPAGSTAASHLGKTRDEVVKASRRVELSLEPDKVNAGVQKADIKPGFTLTAAVKSTEDHGYILDTGVPEVSAFLSFKDAKTREKSKIHTGQILDVTVTKVAAKGRTCHLTLDNAVYSTTALSEISSVSSVLPGTLVQALITGVQPRGLNLQVLGFFDGTIEDFHLPLDHSYKVGKKVKARVLYSFSSSPPRFALALNSHILKLQSPTIDSKPVSDAYPIGRVLDDVEVLRVEAERGLVVKAGKGIHGFVHISQISDEHLPTISNSGPWKVGTLHQARVTGYFVFDGLLQLSLKKSTVNELLLQVTDVQVGETIKGTIKKLTDAGLFVAISSNIDGVVWPNHYADIALKHPSKRFKPGASIKCKVLAVDLERRRISLTVKKTLLESELPVISNSEDAKIGTVAHAVVFQVHPKYLMVEFFNNLKGIVPLKEASDTPISNLAETFPLGRVVKVRIIQADSAERRIVASIRQALIDRPTPVDVGSIDIGNIVEGDVAEIHKDNVVLLLRPSKARALLSLKNLANHRHVSPAQLKTELKPGDSLKELVVVNRNIEQHLVIVANKPKAKASLSKNLASVEDAEAGQVVTGRVTRHIGHGTLVKVSSHVGGILHPTDTSDDYEAGIAHPPIDSIIRAIVVGIDASKSQLILSTRASCLQPESTSTIMDRQISDVVDLQVGDTVRGFVKSVMDHGLFVTIGRNVDARVQIRELFDEFVKDWKPKFQVNQVVKGRILSVNLDTKKVEMSFRSHSQSTTTSIKAADIHTGQIISGVVKRVEEYGIFIQVENSKLSGLCHKTELADNLEADVTAALNGFKEGDKLKAYVLAIEDRRISLSIKPSLLEGALEDSGDLDDDAEPLGVVEGDVDMQSEDGFQAGDHDEEMEDASDQDSDASEIQIKLDQKMIASLSLKAAARREKFDQPLPSLHLSGGFQWSGNTDANISASEASSDESDADGGQSKRKKRKRKEIQQDLTADLQTKMPESNADFERLLLGSPSSSYLWIQYMSFQLQLSEIQKARDVARRAIRTIDFREEQEKLNVWIALLNLENVYGTEETLESTFKEASKANDSKTVYIRLAAIFDQANAHTKAEEQYKRTCKKFGKSSKVWTLFAEHHLRQGNVEEARKLLSRSLQSLEKRKHLKTISRFAQLEYRLGEPERGKTLFEGIVDSHPKRWDLWSIYMDMEATQKDIQSLRNLFDRVLALKMTSHKAKGFFKKWLELEKRLGDEDGQNAVKEKAMEWTQKANSS